MLGEDILHMEYWQTRNCTNTDTQLREVGGHWASAMTQGKWRNNGHQCHIPTPHGQKSLESRKNMYTHVTLNSLRKSFYPIYMYPKDFPWR